jgi:hypothetical protein
MPRLTATDLLFTCKIDKYSEAEIVTLVEDINYAIDNMVMSIMAISRTANPMPVPRTPPSPAHLMGYLDEHWHSRGNAAEFAAEFILVMPDASHLTNTPASCILDQMSCRTLNFCWVPEEFPIEQCCRSTQRAMFLKRRTRLIALTFIDGN